jgi:E3 ubiquitin-protein ligase MARCH6
VIGLSLIFLHTVAAVFRFRRFARLAGIGYVIVKVALLLVIEILAFPVICGYWIDVCSLELFHASLKVSRKMS